MKDFTPVEWIVVSVIIVVLAVIAVPRFRELNDLRARSVIEANTRAVREAVDRQAELTGSGFFPEAITADMFPDGEIPEITAGGYCWEYDPATGIVSNNLPE
jgi:Tfp pilus assembly protein PilE